MTGNAEAGEFNDIQTPFNVIVTLCSWNQNAINECCNMVWVMLLPYGVKAFHNVIRCGEDSIVIPKL